MPDTTVCDAYFNSRPHGGRQNIVFLFLFTRHFNSRPHGGRLFSFFGFSVSTDISTHALTEGDSCVLQPCTAHYISTHALTEGDLSAVCTVNQTQYFNSRPHGGRPLLPHGFDCPFHFNSRPHGGRRSGERKDLFRRGFQLTPSRRATMSDNRYTLEDIFQLTPSRRATISAR